MGTERVQNLPHDTIAFVVVQRLFGRDASRDADGQDDVAHVLSRCATHDAPDRLHHVDLRFARMHEQDCVERRNIHAFGQATGIGEDAASVIAVFLFQPVQQAVAGLGVECASTCSS